MLRRGKGEGGEREEEGRGRRREEGGRGEKRRKGEGGRGDQGIIPPPSKPRHFLANVFSSIRYSSASINADKWRAWTIKGLIILAKGPENHTYSLAIQTTSNPLKLNMLCNSNLLHIVKAYTAYFDA